MIDNDDGTFRFDQLELGDFGEPAKKAKSLYSNEALVRVATAAIHRGGDRAFEYLRTAPVLVLGISFGAKKISRASEYAQIAGMFRLRVEEGPKLRDLMRHYRVAPQFRKLAGRALSPNKYSIISRLSRDPDMSPALLAQSIPEKSYHQHLWLYALERWFVLCDRRNGGEVRLKEWAVSRLNGFTHNEQLRIVSDLVDFATRGPDAPRRFDPRWTFDQAYQAMERWHLALGRMNDAERFRADHGRGWDEDFPVPDGLLADETVAGFRFVAVNSGAKLFEEGRAMRHCVSSYSAPCALGQYLVYSLRDGRDRRVATLGLRFEHGYWIKDQIKGHCNRPVGPDASNATARFLANYRQRRNVK